MFDRLLEFLHRIDARQQESRFDFHYVDEHRVCSHCGTEYTGNICPQCGLDHMCSRFTWRSTFGKFADSVGFNENGNRGIMRTLRDLLWRPGYMIRDYLNGHSSAYFQPFKLLLLLAIFYMVLAHVTGLAPERELLFSNLDKKIDDQEVSEALAVIKPILTFVSVIVQWFRRNIAYSIFLQNIFIVNAMHRTYHNRASYSWIETFIAQMYFCCQFLMIAIVQLLVTWRYQEDNIFPYFVNGWIVVVVMLYDFFQFYGEHRLLPALWRLFLVVFSLLLQYIVIIVLGILILAIYVGMNLPAE